MLKKIKVYTIAVLMFALLAPALVLAADTPPAMPLLVYGDVKIDSVNAAVGTVVAVFNGASEIARTTVGQAGKYYIEVPTENNIGAILAYKVNGTQAAPTTVCPNPLTTPSVRIDLAIATTPAPTPAPAPSSSGSSSGGGTYTAPSTPSTPSATPTTPTLPATPLTTTPQVLGVKITADEQLNQIFIDATAIWTENISTILANAGLTVRDQNAEKITSDKYLSSLTHDEINFLPEDANRLNWFITYGTAGTKILGAGERAGVLNSYKAAFSKLPKTETEWQDVIKIANGRWPTERSETAEANAKISFKKIYGREADMNNQNDNAAVTVMAYGLRPSARNLNSEKVAIVSFKYFMKRNPASAVDWDIVRAIAYSGAKR